MAPFLSIIIPAHNEERRLPKTLETVDQFLQQQPYTSEILVVENGSIDKTFEIASAYCDRIRNLQVFQLNDRGKGMAVKFGMLKAAGQYRFFCDADLSMPITEVNKFIPPILQDVEISIASREIEGATRFGEPAYRHLIGRIFNSLVRLLALPHLQDTQCGFKCFRGEIAEEVFPCQTFNGMSFDAEVLFIASLRGYKITEVPIPWYFNSDSRVRLFQDSLQMALDLLTIRMNSRKGLYNRNSC